MSKRLTTQQFITKAQAIHGDKYNYSLVEYITSLSKVRILCPTHGIFEQRPSEHFRGKGCIECSGSKRITTKQFITKAQKVHGNKYDYSLVEYKNNKTKVKIICPEHGIFEQKPESHTNQKQGCFKCEPNYPLTTETWITKAIKVHGDRYNYSKVVYTNSSDNVEIICKEHGMFSQRPADHLMGVNCPTCSNKLSDGDCVYIWKSNMIWNDKPVWKIGITSERLGYARIRRMANEAKLEVVKYKMLVTDKAREIEKIIQHSLNDIPPMNNLLCGYTEFRAVDDKEIEELFNLNH